MAGPSVPTALRQRVAEYRKRPTKFENPFPGARPFTAAEHSNFFGRDRELTELVSLVRAQQVVLLYAPSGAGKSSLIHAGVLHELGYEPPRDDQPSQPIDLTTPPDESLIETGTIDVIGVANVHPSTVRDEQGWPAKDTVPNVYTTAALNSLERTSRSEFFTLADYLTARARRFDEFGDPLPRLIVLDQFEELLEPFARKDWLNCRTGFMTDLNRALDADPSLHVLIGIREDHLASIERLLDHVTTPFQARYRLDKLSTAKAQEAIRGPSSESGLPVHPDALDKLVHDLSLRRVAKQIRPVPDAYVDPGYLSVVCHRIWNRAHDDVIKRKLDPEAAQITLEHVDEAGGVDGALESYYDDAIELVWDKRAQRRLRNFFENRLIGPHGTRQLVPQGDKGNKTHGISNTILEDLDDSYGLVRKEHRGGVDYWELSHDGFVQPIQRANAIARQERNDFWFAGLGVLVFAALAGLVAWSTWFNTEPSATQRIEIVDEARSESFDSDQLAQQFEFRGEAGQVVSVTMSTKSPAVLPRLQIFAGESDNDGADKSPLGEAAATIDPDSASTGTFSAELQAVLLPEAGDYRIVATNDLQQEGDYTIDVELVDIETPLGGELMAWTDLVAGESISGRVEPGQVQLFEFPGQAGALIEVVSESTSDMSGAVYVQLLDDDARRVGDASSTDRTELPATILPTDASYTVMVFGDGEYSFAVQAVAPSAFGQQGTYRGALDAQATDVVSFLASAGQVVVVETSSDDSLFEVGLTLVDDDNNTLGSTTARSSEPGRIVTNLPRTGQYAVQVQDLSGAGGDYTVTLDRVDVQQIDGQLPLAPSMLAADPGAPPGSRVVGPTALGAGETVILDAGETVAFSIERSSLGLRASTTGAMQIGVRRAPLSQGTATVTMSPQVLGHAGVEREVGDVAVTALRPFSDMLIALTAVEPGAFQFGVSAVTTVPLNPDQPVRDLFSADSTSAIYQFAASAGDVVSLKMSSTEIDSQLQLFSPDGISVASDDDGGGDRNSFIDSFVVEQSGSYTLLASSRNGGAGDYEVAFQQS